jgi:hypothetical protein
MKPADWMRAVTGAPIATGGRQYVPVRLGVAVYLRVGPIEHEVGTLVGVDPAAELPDLLEAVAAELRTRLAE